MGRLRKALLEYFRLGFGSAAARYQGVRRVRPGPLAKLTPMTSPVTQSPPRITVIGAGMAGSDAAFAAANLGVHVDLFEMRPVKMTPAHRTGSFAELVCSNSFGGEGETNAKGLLQREMLAASGLVMSYRPRHADSGRGSTRC